MQFIYTSFTENHKDFRWGFQTLANLCYEINGFVWDLTTLIADNAEAITFGFKKALSHCVPYVVGEAVRTLWPKNTEHK